MIYGIEGAPIPSSLPFAGDINQVCVAKNFPPLVAYAIAWNETIEEYGAAAAAKLQDGWDSDPGYNGECGHGLFQLTSSGPTNWQDPLANAEYAIDNFLLTAMQQWHDTYGLTGDNLVKATAASFNAGFEGAVQGHLEFNDVDHFTTNDYGARALQHYKSLLGGGSLQ